MSDLPGFESVYGEGPARPREEPSFRLKPINRNQLLLRPVDVEKLVPADHEVRAIWEFAGHIDLTAYYQDIKAVEGRAGSTAFDPRLRKASALPGRSPGSAIAIPLIGGSPAASPSAITPFPTFGQPIKRRSMDCSSMSSAYSRTRVS